MSYLMGEMTVLLLLACAIGLVVGWGIRQMMGGGGNADREQELSLQIGRVEAERNELKARLRRVQAEGGLSLELNNTTGAAATATAATVAAVSASPAGGSAQAGGEYRVADLPGVNEKALHMMRDVGIRTTHDLLRESEGESKLRLLATALEQEVEQVREWRTMADLLRVPGMDEKHARLLVATGIMSVDSLHECKVEELHGKLQAANAELKLTSEVVDQATVADWANYASPLSQLDLDG